MCSLMHERFCNRLVRSTKLMWQTRRLINTRKYVTKMFQNFGKIQPPSTNLSCKSQKLMLYNDVVQASHAGAHHMLPLGLRSLEKLIKIIDQEMQAIGGQKISMPSLATASLWKKSGRWTEGKGELFKVNDRHGIQYCLGPTHEELVTDLFASISPISYKRLPVLLYQITRKFRDEMAPKFGLLRGKEFEMKDMYTFDATEEDAIKTYESVCNAYCKILERLGVKYIKAAGDTGNIGGSFSHEFHLPATVGEDRLLICDKCGFASNVELIANYDSSNPKQFCPNKETSCQMQETAGIEIGHTFLLGKKYSSVFKATYHTNERKAEFVQMGCYGLGVTRILQGCVEMLSSEKCIHWPQLISPYQVCIIPQKEGFKADMLFQLSDDLSDRLTSMSSLAGEVVIDDRTQMTVGKRMYEAKRIGYPHVVVVGKKALDADPLYEVFSSPEEDSLLLTSNQLIEHLSTVETVSLP